jgi:hypothetical protein
MDEARKVLERLDRIEALERGGAPAPVLLAELRALLVEAEDWARSEAAGETAARAAVRSLRGSLVPLPAALEPA